MSSATYGDSSGRPPTTSIYAYHMDSRNREAPLTSTPSTYTIKLGAAVPRVRTIQVGDVQLPTSARRGIDYARRHFQLSEPLKLAVPTTLSLQETTRTYDRTSGALLSTTVHAAATVSFPPTLLSVASVAGTTVTFTASHFMDSVVAYWPAAAPPSVFVGARTVNFDTTVSSTTLDATTPFPAATQLTLDAAYVADVLTHTVGLPALTDVLDGVSLTATLLVTPLTVPEWVAVLHEALADLTTNGSLTQRYSLAMNATTGLVELRAMGGDVVTRSTRVTTDVSFTVVASDAMWRLGFPAGTWPLRTYKNERVDTETGHRVDETPYVLAVPARDARTIQLRRGTYAAVADLTAELTRATNSLTLDAALSTGARTLTFTDATGAARTIVCPAGRYTPTQMADFIETSMNTAPTVNGSFAVTANDAGLHAAGTFTISDTLGRPFALDFSAAAAAPLASALGFEPARLAGAASYTSTREAYCGLSTAGPDTDTARVVTWGVDALTSTLRATASKPIPSADATTGIFVGNVTQATFFELGTGAAGTPVAMHLAVGDAIRLSDGTSSVLVLVSAASGTGDPINIASVSFGAVLPATDIAVVGVLTATPVARPDFVLHMAPLTTEARPAPQDVSGIAIYNATLPSPASYTGTAEAYGPVYEQLGLAPTTLQSSTAGVLLAPSVYTLDPPPYVLLALVSPTCVSERAVFRPAAGADPRPVLAKFIVSNGYARITEESTHVTTTSAVNIAKVTVAWLNPDGTYVDWNGANHSYSLLFRVFEGHVSGAGVH